MSYRPQQRKYYHSGKRDAANAAPLFLPVASRLPAGCQRFLAYWQPLQTVIFQWFRRSWLPGCQRFFIPPIKLFLSGEYCPTFYFLYFTKKCWQPGNLHQQTVTFQGFEAVASYINSAGNPLTTGNRLFYRLKSPEQQKKSLTRLTCPHWLNFAPCWPSHL